MLHQQAVRQMGNDWDEESCQASEGSWQVPTGKAECSFGSAANLGHSGGKEYLIYSIKYSTGTSTGSTKSSWWPKKRRHNWIWGNNWLIIGLWLQRYLIQFLDGRNPGMDEIHLEFVKVSSWRHFQSGYRTLDQLQRILEWLFALCLWGLLWEK